MECKVGQIVELNVNGRLEMFRVKYIGRKYIYYVSDTYSSDGAWRNLKADRFNSPSRVLPKREIA